MKHSFTSVSYERAIEACCLEFRIKIACVRVHEEDSSPAIACSLFFFLISVTFYKFKTVCFSMI